jgi:hypothetical protein
MRFIHSRLPVSVLIKLYTPNCGYFKEASVGRKPNYIIRNAGEHLLLFWDLGPYVVFI